MIQLRFLRPSIILVTLASFFILNRSLPAQKSFDAGLFLGAANYMGDFAQDPFTSKEFNYAVGLVARQYFNPTFALKGFAGLGKVSGDDVNTGNDVTRGWKFNAAIYEASLHFEIHPLATSRINIYRSFKTQITPYVFGGVGIAHAKDKLTVPTKDLGKLPDPKDISTFLTLPMGGGLRIEFNDSFLTSLEFGARTPLSDHFDGLSKYGNPKRNDWYLFTGLMVTYLFYADY